MGVRMSKKVALNDMIKLFRESFKGDCEELLRNLARFWANEPVEQCLDDLESPTFTDMLNNIGGVCNYELQIECLKFVEECYPNLKGIVLPATYGSR